MHYQSSQLKFLLKVKMARYKWSYFRNIIWRPSSLEKALMPFLFLLFSQFLLWKKKRKSWWQGLDSFHHFFKKEDVVDFKRWIYYFQLIPLMMGLCSQVLQTNQEKIVYFWQLYSWFQQNLSHLLPARVIFGQNYSTSSPYFVGLSNCLLLLICTSAERQFTKMTLCQSTMSALRLLRWPLICKLIWQKQTQS